METGLTQIDVQGFCNESKPGALAILVGGLFEVPQHFGMTESKATIVGSIQASTVGRS